VIPTETLKSGRAQLREQFVPVESLRRARIVRRGVRLVSKFTASSPREFDRPNAEKEKGDARSGSLRDWTGLDSTRASLLRAPCSVALCGCAALPLPHDAREKQRDHHRSVHCVRSGAGGQVMTTKVMGGRWWCRENKGCPSNRGQTLGPVPRHHGRANSQSTYHTHAHTHTHTQWEGGMVHAPSHSLGARDRGKGGRCCDVCPSSIPPSRAHSST
jgi:hypothetical protein